MYYSGIGSRKTPSHVLNRITPISFWLAKNGFSLRTGGAVGADKAFENACFVAGGKLSVYTSDSPLEDWWFEEARLVHPAWQKCSLYAKKLHARNTPIILGDSCDPECGFPQKSKFVLCWTKDGAEVGGTGQGIRLANKYHIPIFNLFHGRKTEVELYLFLEEIMRK